MGKKFSKILAIILAFGILACLCAVPMTASADEQTPLKFGSDGKFKIVIFSDVQDQFPVYQRVINIMKQAITRENPDLVVFLGDNTEQNIKDPEVDFRRTLNQILAPVVEANVPYAFVFGNHDDQSYYSGQRTDKEAMLSVYQSIGDCRTVDADPSLYGTGTCKIPIYASNGNNIAFDLFMIDSNAYQIPTDTSSGYGSPHTDQLEWVAANKDAGVNSLVFQHIPMPENYNLLVEGNTGKTRTYGGKTYIQKLNENATGYLGEFPNPCPANCNTGEFATLKSMGGVLGVFTGHDHTNDYTGTYDGLNLTAVPGMTYFNYGDEAVRGYGVIELNESDLSDYDYHTVKFSTLDAEAGTPPETTYDSYDTVTYADLRKNGSALPETYNIHGSNTFTYTATSPTKSAIFKFRWTAGAETGIQFSFDEGDGGNISHPFGVWVKKPSQANAGANGAWHLRADKGDDTRVDLTTPIRRGDIFDIELGRLKVLTGNPQHVGQYYVYLKVNDVLIMETYSNTSEDGEYKTGELLRSVSNEIRFGDWSSNDNGNLISEYGIGAEPGQQGEDPPVEDPESPYYDYDEITYYDLLDNGSPLSAETSMSGGKTFTYNATSPTYSTILKYRWKACSTSKFQLSFDKAGSGVNYMFGTQLYVPGSEGHTNTSIRLRPGLDDSHAWNELDFNIEDGGYYDIEFARLKVKTGDNAGKYYMYFKLNGVLISESYVAANIVDADGNYTSNPGNAACSLSNEIYLTFWGGSGDKILATPEPETYYDYDEVSYENLLINGSPVNPSGMDLSSTRRCTYTATSPTYSSVLKFRWTASSDPHFVLYYDAWAGSAYPFCLAVKRPGYGDLGAAAGVNGAWHIDPSVKDHIAQMSEPIVEGNTYDLEFGRLKVKSGANKDKYYVYLKVDGELISYYYYDGVSSDGTYGNGAGTLSNNVIFTSGGSNFISATPVPETYEDYDEVYYSNLFVNGNPVAEERSGQGTAYTYNKTSASGSAVLKLRWKGANTGTQFQLSFDKKGSDNAINYMFGMQYYGVSAEYPNGYIWLRPGYGPKAELPEPIVSGNNYDLEFARLKVATGPNKGKYYMYFKMNDQLVAEDYVPLGTVDSNGDYTSNPGSTLCTISNQMYITFWGGGATITNPPFVETYEDYDEIGYEDLIQNGNPLSIEGTTISGGTVFNYIRTSPTGSAILKYRWKVGSVAKVQMSFEKTSASAMAYQFGAWLSEPGADAGYTNGKMWLIPGSGPQVNMPYQLQPGNSYNVEFGRLKVKNGSNKGKYYIYFKIDNTLVAETYVPLGVVDSNLEYTSNPGNTSCSMKSNEIFFAHWGSEGNKISAYLETAGGPVTAICDFDGNGELGAADLAALTQVLLGAMDMSEMPEGAADFNHDGEENILDLIALKKYLAPVNTYTRSGNLVLGMQEHLYESSGDFTDSSKTPAYIADASATLGAGVYRLSMTPGMFYKATATGGLRVYNNTNLNNLKAMVAALKAQGIDDILYVADSFILPYGYENAEIRHGITVPDPKTEPEYYQAWLEINALGFAAVAQQCPEIRYFEPFNEINLTGTRMEKSGCAWNSTPEEQANYKFTVQEKARIMADLCYYISEAVKAVNPANQVTTPSVCVGSNISTLEGNFLDVLYNTIESGTCPTGKAIGDMRVDNYFTIVNIHNYPDYTDDIEQQQMRVNNAAADINALYAVVQAHNDGGSRVWISETGASSLNGNGTVRDLDAGANLINLYLNKINNDLTFIDTVIFYKIADISTDYKASYVETGFGLFYAGDDLDYPYEAKPIAKTVYSFFHNGSTNHSALDEFVARYAE